LESIPLESIEPAKHWLMAQSDTRNDGVIVYGLSKGAELALLLASIDEDYKGVIATAPSAVVWNGIPQNPGNDYSEVSSSWSYQNKPVAYIEYLNREPFRAEGITMRDWHSASLKAATNFSDARIKVENIQGPMLLFSGGLDDAWPSVEMGESICAIANLTGNNGKCKHVIYEQAPHILGEYGPDARLEMGRFLDRLNQVKQ
jgi:dienelactone hydrolase